jgi:Flp pilus assembly protein TadG
MASVAQNQHDARITMTRSRSINKQLYGQRGTVLILFALLLPVFIGFMALAVDLAYLNLTRVEVQNAADAAALAGARKFADTTSFSVAQTEAQAMVAANGAKISDATIEQASVPGYTYAVKVTINSGPMNFFFAPFLGVASSSDVQASAIAAQSPSKPGHSILVE